MRGLFEKDIRIIKNQKKMMLIFAGMGVLLLLSGVEISFILPYMASVMTSVAISTISYDSMDNGNSFLFTLPVRRKDYATEKYFFVCGFGAVSALIVAIACGILLLDVMAREGILDALRAYMEQEERAILISSHISGDLENLCDDLYLIDQGKIRLHEDTDVLLDQYGILKVTESEFAALDKQYILAYCKEDFGYCCLTDQKQYYMENMPQIVIEKGTIDEVMKTMLKGSSRKGVSL